MAIHEHPLGDLYGILVKMEVKCLGVVITRDRKTREEQNIEIGIKKSKSILDSWLQRDLSIFGRVLITKI